MDNASSYSLRPVEEGDQQFLLELFASTRKEELDQAPFTPEQRQAFELQQFRAQSLHYSTHFPQAQHSLVLIGGQRVGRIYIERQPDHILLVDLALMPEYRGCGLGGRLMSRLIEESEASGRELRLSVFVGNPRALAFYQRLGFQLTSQVQDLYLPMHRTPNSGHHGHVDRISGANHQVGG